MDKKVKRSDFIVGLDSLKFFAIILIVIYHLFPNLLPGGFITVEIFFVISGFLIARSLLSRHTDSERHGPRAFLSFFGSRLGRLFPPLLLCMILTLSLAFFTNPDLLTSARPDSLYAATFSTNIANILTDASYESSLTQNLFNHTWFLALDFQACLLLYIIYMFFFSIFDKKSKSRLPAFGILCAALGLVSFALMALYGGFFGSFDRAYFGPDSHIGAFLFGAALASFVVSKKSKKPTTHRYLWWLATSFSIFIILLMSPCFSFSSWQTFCIALPAVALLSVLLVLSVLHLQSKKPASRLLVLPEYLGHISYYIYLFHWPLNILLTDLLSFISLDIIPFVTIIISLILSILADKFIIPFFSRIDKKSWWKLLILAALLVLPVLSLIKSEDTSSIEKQLDEASESQPEIIESADPPKIDYLGIDSLAATLNSDVMKFYDKTTDFAKVYIPPAVPYTGGYIVNHGANYDYSSRAYFSTPDLSYGSLSTLAAARTMVVGDSVTLGATANLYATVPSVFVDALGSRNMFDAIGLLAGYRAANGGNLPYIIVIGLITNYSAFGIDTLQTIVDTAGPGHQFVFVTGNCGAISRDAQNATLFAFASMNGNVHIADWASVVNQNLAAYTYADNIHLTPLGRQAYADLVNSIVSGL